MVWNWVVQLVVAVALSVVSYLLTPKPKTPNIPIKDLQSPTASAGRPIPVIFGSITCKSGNVLWYGEKFQRKYRQKV